MAAESRRTRLGPDRGAAEPQRTVDRLARNVRARAPRRPTYEGIRLKAVDLSARGVRGLLLGLLQRHALAALPRRHPRADVPPHWWQAYAQVNMRFAAAVAEDVAPGGTVWVHDYQLQLVPQMLRELRPDVRIGFFLHIPFPPIELFMQLPWRREILAGLLGADLIGFQVTRRPRTSRAWPGGSLRRPAPTRCSTSTAAPSASARFRSRWTANRSSNSRTIPAIRARAQGDPPGPRRPRVRAARRRPTRLHQGHPAAHQGGRPRCSDDGSLIAERHVMVQVAVPEPRDRRALRARTPQPRAGGQRDQRRARPGRAAR